MNTASITQDVLELTEAIHPNGASHGRSRPRNDHHKPGLISKHSHTQVNINDNDFGSGNDNGKMKSETNSYLDVSRIL